MKKKIYRRKIIFCPTSNFDLGNSGDSVNDRKLFDCIPDHFKRIALFPKYNEHNKIMLKSYFTFFFQYLWEILNSDNIFITRGSKRAILPILTKKILRNKVILRLGCTPLMFVERMALEKNPQYKSEINILKKSLIKIEPYLEKFALKHADKILVENAKAKKIIQKFGAKPTKIQIIPYYIQDYFLECKNPQFNDRNDYFILCYTGRFKNYDILIPILKAVETLIKENYQVKLILLGEGPKLSLIKRIVNEIKLNDSIEFLGAIPHIEVSKIIDKSHCLILPMLNKICPSTIPIKILEGIMKGKIIITTNSGNVSSLFLDHTNLILDTLDNDSIVKKLKEIMKNFNKYKLLAKDLRNFHLKRRTKGNYEKKLKKVIYELY